MKIRRATVGDADTIAPLFAQYRQFYNQSSDEPGALRFITERLEKNESVIFLAFSGDDDSAIGFAQLYPSFSSVSMKRLWILNDLYVAPQTRRSGAAKALMNAGADFARASGARSLTLKTALDNLPAQALYESLGWKRDEKFYSYNLAL